MDNYLVYQLWQEVSKLIISVNLRNLVNANYYLPRNIYIGDKENAEYRRWELLGCSAQEISERYVTHEHRFAAISTRVGGPGTRSRRNFVVPRQKQPLLHSIDYGRPEWCGGCTRQDGTDAHLWATVRMVLSLCRELFHSTGSFWNHQRNRWIGGAAARPERETNIDWHLWTSFAIWAGLHWAWFWYCQYQKLAVQGERVYLITIWSINGQVQWQNMS